MTSENYYAITALTNSILRDVQLVQGRQFPKGNQQSSFYYKSEKIVVLRVYL